MLRKFLLFAAVSILFFGIFLGFHNIFPRLQEILPDVGSNALAASDTNQYTAHAVSGEVTSVELEDLGIELYAGDGLAGSESSLKTCTKSVSKALKALPAEHVFGLKKLTFTFDPLSRRGLAGSNQITVRCVNIDDNELMAVMVHELAHVVDTGINLIGDVEAGESGFYDGSLPIYKNDPSVYFYRIGFEENATAKDGRSKLDFVSAYAMTDPFEDFAETYAYYVLHGNAFRSLAESNTNLAKKYRFMKNRVFYGKEYGIKDEEADVFGRPYDVTQLEYDVEEFLAGYPTA